MSMYVLSVADHTYSSLTLENTISSLPQELASSVEVLASTWSKNLREKVKFWMCNTSQQNLANQNFKLELPEYSPGRRRNGNQDGLAGVALAGVAVFRAWFGAASNPFLRSIILVELLAHYKRFERLNSKKFYEYFYKWNSIPRGSILDGEPSCLRKIASDRF